MVIENCPFGKACKFDHKFLKKAEKEHLTRPRSASRDTKGNGQTRNQTPGAKAKAKAKAKGKAQAKADPKRTGRTPSRGRKPNATPGEEQATTTTGSGKKAKLYCKAFLDVGSCKDPNCTAINHFTADKVEGLKQVYGENLQLYYNPPKHKPAE